MSPAKLPIAEVDALPGVGATVEFGHTSAQAFGLTLWLDTRRDSKRFMDAGGFWAMWQLGDVHAVRFAFRQVVFNRALFEAVEVRPAHDPVLHSPGVLWLPSAPRRPLLGAIS